MNHEPLLDQVRRSITEAGLTLTDESKPCGVQLHLTEGPPGVRATWAVHPDLYTDQLRGRETLEILDIMNLALMAVLTTQGWDVLPGPPGKPTLILGRRPPRPDPDAWELP
jgi:hypothetical protein